MDKLLKISLVSACYLALAPTIYADEITADQRFIYIGSELGIVEPVKRKFDHKNHDNSKTAITLKQSSMYSGRIGYSFYPKMAIEFSATYQPKYRLGYVLPAQDFGDGIPVKTAGITKVISNVYMFNLLYDLENFKGFTPFVQLGAGLAQIRVKATDSSFNGFKFFRINKTDTNCFAWQVGLGLSKEVARNFSIDAGVKLQVVRNVKVKYDTLDTANRFVPSKPIKKTIGVGEFGIGFTYKIPV